MTMWGDPKRANSLDENDNLAVLLLQSCSPAHIAWDDTRWKEIIFGCDVWVHVEPNQKDGVMHRACQNMTKNAALSSNLATLCLHASLHVQHVVTAVRACSTNDIPQMSNLVQTARIASGAIKLCMMFCHELIIQSSRSDAAIVTMEDAMVYRSRKDHEVDIDAGTHLIDSILDLVSIMNTAANKASSKAWTIPEVYDTVVFALDFIVVLSSTQLYSPFVSSYDAASSNGSNGSNTSNGSNRTTLYALDHMMNRGANQGRSISPLEHHANSRTQSIRPPSVSSTSNASSQHWNPNKLMSACMEIITGRPECPPGSIAHYFRDIGTNIAKNTKARTVQDGLHDAPDIVFASTARDVEYDDRHHHASSENGTARKKRTSLDASTFIADTTHGILSSVVLLPWRFVRLVIGLWAHGSSMQHALLSSRNGAASHDVLWISDSPVADLATSLVVVLANNFRNESTCKHPFRAVLHTFADKRWEPLLVKDGSGNGSSSTIDPFTNGDQNGGGGTGTSSTDAQYLDENDSRHQRNCLQVDVESLVGTLGQTLHTESADLFLYTLLQSAPSFAEAISVRSDRDTLVSPILRILYNYTSSRVHHAKHTTRHSTDRNSEETTLRSTSHIYVCLILVLIFSQDISFGNDAFQRIDVAEVAWYKERQLRNINFGSLLLLCLLRCLLFGLVRLRDPFVLSNCCAILTNIAPTIVNLHEYAAMRLASVTVTILRRYAADRKQDAASDDGDAMQAQAVETIMYALHQCLAKSKIHRNLHLLYALVYYQSDLNPLLKAAPQSKATTDIWDAISQATTVIQERGGWSAAEAMNVLECEYNAKPDAADDRSFPKAEYRCSYEEEHDSESFFVPYIWNVIVSTVCSGTLHWDKRSIAVFKPDDIPRADPAPVASDEPVADAKPASNDNLGDDMV